MEIVVSIFKEKNNYRMREKLLQTDATTFVVIAQLGDYCYKLRQLFCFMSGQILLKSHKLSEIEAKF